jgi:hypothetical protein
MALVHSRPYLIAYSIRHARGLIIAPRGPQVFHRLRGVFVVVIRLPCFRARWPAA